jgi:hypothetical protein
VCGAHIGTRSPRFATAYILKVGTMDDPGAYGGPGAAIFLKDKQSFHHVGEGLARFEGAPGAR